MTQLSVEALLTQGLRLKHRLLVKSAEGEGNQVSKFIHNLNYFHKG